VSFPEPPGPQYRPDGLPVGMPVPGIPAPGTSPPHVPSGPQYPSVEKQRRRAFLIWGGLIVALIGVFGAIGFVGFSLWQRGTGLESLAEGDCFDVSSDFPESTNLGLRIPVNCTELHAAEVIGVSTVSEDEAANPNEERFSGRCKSLAEDLGITLKVREQLGMEVAPALEQNPPKAGDILVCVAITTDNFYFDRPIREILPPEKGNIAS
jgi:hypothetical protein